MSKSRLVSAAGNVVRVWEHSPNSGGSGLKLEKEVTPHTGAINCVCWNHNNQVYATCSDDGSFAMVHVSGIVIENNIPGVMPEEAPSQKKPIYTVAFNSKSRYVVTGGESRKVEVWDLKKKEPIRSFRGARSAITSARFSVQDEYVAAGSKSGEILIHKIRTGQTMSTLLPPDQQHCGSVTAVALNRLYANTMGSCYADGSVLLWDVEAAACYKSFHMQHRDEATSIAFSPQNDKLMGSIGKDCRMLFYDTRAKRALNRVVDTVSPLKAACFHMDGSIFAASSLDGKVYFVDLRNDKEPLTVIDVHPQEAVRGLSFQSGDSREHRAEKARVVGLDPHVTEPKVMLHGSSEGNLNSKKRQRDGPAQTKGKMLIPEADKVDVPRSVPVMIEQGLPASSDNGEKQLSDKDSVCEAWEESKPARTAPPYKEQEQYQQHQQPQEQQFAAPMPASDYPAAEDSRKRTIPYEELLEALKVVVGEKVDGIREDVHRKIECMHLDMLRQFQGQQDEMMALLEAFSTKLGGLVEENAMLREENDALRRVY